MEHTKHMNVLITYKDSEPSSPTCWIRDVEEVTHNSQMRILIIRTEKRVYFINIDMVRHVEMIKGEELPKPTL